MFPKINSILRKKEISQIENLSIDQSSTILIDADLETDHLEKTDRGKFIINDLQDKLDIIGAHFASINNRFIENNKPRPNENVTNETDKFKRQIKQETDNNVTICNFNKDNLANDPKPAERYKGYFTNDYEMTKGFRKMNNKRSCGLDNIPNIVLKNIPIALIVNYTILFNNILNYAFFPDEWKIAKVIAILKKDKDKTSPTSYRQQTDKYVTQH